MSQSKKLLNTFYKLPAQEQEILTILAVFYSPIGQEKFKGVVKNLSCVDTALFKAIDKNLRLDLDAQGLLELSRDGWRCVLELREPLTRIAAKNNPELLQEIAAYFASYNEYIPSHLDLVYLIRQYRLAYYLGDIKQYAEMFEEVSIIAPARQLEVMDTLVFNDFDEAFFNSRSAGMKLFILVSYIDLNSLFSKNIESHIQLLEIEMDKIKDDFFETYQEVLESYLEYHLMQGHLDVVAKNIESCADTLRASYILASYLFLNGQNNAAIEVYQASIATIKKETRKRNIAIPGVHGYFYHLALFKTNKSENLALIKTQIKFLSKNAADEFSGLNACLKAGIDYYNGSINALDSFHYGRVMTEGYDHLFYLLQLYWLGLSDQIELISISTLAVSCQKAEQNGNQFYAALGFNLLAKLKPKDTMFTKKAKNYQDLKFLHLIDFLPRVERWEKALQALSQLNNLEKSTTKSEARLIWLLSLDTYEGVTLEPREQKLGKSGKWSKGRAVALKRLYKEPETVASLSEQDKIMCRKITSEPDYYYGYNNETYHAGGGVLLLAEGHPHIFWADANQYITPITIKKAEPQLLVQKKGENLLISLYPDISNQGVLMLDRTADNELLMYEINEKHQQVADILGKKGIVVPKSAKQQVIDSIATISSTLTVQSDLGGLAQNIESVETDSRLHLHLLPADEGIQIDAFVQPFNNIGPIYKPAAGGLTVLAEIDDKQVQTERDFKLENKYLKQLQEQCTELYPSNDYKWDLNEPENALNALMQLQELGDFAVLEWPKGQRIKVTRELGLTDVHFSVRKEKDWFSVEGELKVSDAEVYDMQRLINLLSASTGRFLKLENGQFISLTNELRQRLSDITGLGEQAGNGVRFHNLAVPALNEALDGMEIEFDQQWQDQLKKLAAMTDLEPLLPTTLQGELRDYQLEGFQWMSRLAHWGAGACLADDMGLGKTIQSLALLLQRALTGPALILAPTSVCMNWMEEAQKFAPTLNIKHFGTGNRQKIIDEADAFDVIVCSYGLLQTESELLINKPWHTIIADEAQALKNGATKRSKAAMALQADFKMVTTGTPIENHLGELWNLFHFINPGLLGSLKKFNERYAQAIENDKDHETQIRLKKLLRPFILRRLKTDVLKELPSRTEITLHVELSDEERTFYEALRRNAMESMRKAQEEAQAGAQHLQVLAEIMKLRRACCHPKLVVEDSPLSSAKLQAFEGLIEELLANRHKALVFSQFVSHLAIIKELLDKKGINYQYLDGSTSVAKRKKAVNSFQAGEGDVFLISLKAGGSGLNLTAADYVIHMDPWWNPAVEDQASDRAHRMGQKRPVTIYRLVAKDTIEDKIVDLHAHKRDLASSLLEGGEVSGKMSVSDMMNLIQEEAD
ncbi:MAG: DEAD/DEAH box helicase [Methyloprofundus sp.]|nr:DEAD/DEAH box helicase [Methyloprofundus sp.]